MMIISYFWGQKVYPVPYATGKLLSFFGLMLLFYFVHAGICMLTEERMIRIGAATVLVIIYLLYIVRAERNDLKRLPVIGKYLG